MITYEKRLLTALFYFLASTLIYAQNCMPYVAPINLGADQNICQGQTTTLTAPAGYNSYLWSTGATTQSITVNSGGTYSVTGTVLIPSQTNLVVNPGFTQGNTGFSSSYTVGNGGSWGPVSNGNTYSIVTNPNSAHVHLANCPYQGNMLVANGGNLGNNANVWCQTIAVTPNTNYIFSVDAINPHNNAGWGVLPLTLNMVINGNNVGSLTPPMSPNNCNWQTYSSSVWNSGTSTSVTICIQNTTNTASLLAIDNLNFAAAVPCTSTDEIIINVVNTITPTFAQVGPYCSGASIPALPTTSQNGISGTWSPAINNTATTTYTFTPTAGQCANPTTMTITITPQPAAPTLLCYQTAAWNPATCVWDITGTPPNVTPINLGADQNICQGQTTTLTAPPGYNSYLWSTGATTQSITVNSGGTYSVTGTVLIQQPNLVVNPGFTQGNTGFSTSYTVGNGGSWGPVSNGNTYSIVTTPSSAHVHLANCPYQGNMLVANGGNLGNNANVWCQTITVTPNTNYIFSVDAINPHNNAGWGVLPLTLNMVINGNNVGSLTPPMSPNNCNWQTYSSSVWNSGTSTSVTICIQNATNTASLLAIDNLNFSPVMTCTYTDEITINMVNTITPTFAQVGPYCSGATIPALPTTSQNGISGTWSPAINNTATTTYTFTPTAGQCATTATMTIAVNSCGYEVYVSAVWVDDCSIQDFNDGQFYNITGSGVDQINPAPNNDFNNRYYGQFVQNSSVFWLRGAELKTNKVPGGSNVCTPKMFYRVYLTAGAPGAFQPFGGWNINWRANCDVGQNMFVPFSSAFCNLSGQQLWQCVSQPDCNLPVDLTQYAPGDYTLEIYFEVPGSQTTTNQCNDVVYVNNSGNNYKATFTIIHPGQNGTLNICAGQIPTNTQLFNALNGNPTPGGTWTNVGNIYTYTVFPAPCNPATATVTVVPQNPPNAGTNGTLTLCQGITPTNAQLFAQLGGNPDVGGTWSNVGNVYTYTVPAVAPCTTNATATVTVNFTPPTTPTFSQVGPYCSGATIPALPTTSQNSITGTWSPAINNTATTTYTFTPTAGQCANPTTMTITITPQPAAPTLLCYQTAAWNPATCVWDITGTPPNVTPINLGADLDLCQGQTTTLTAPPGYNSYLWSTGATTQSITVNSAGTYSVTGTVLIQQPNLVVNPGFTQGNTGFSTSYTVGNGGPWGPVSNGNTYSIVTTPSSAHVHLANCPYQGNMLVANGGNLGNNANVWCQTIAVTPNTNYIFSVDAINPHNNAGWGVLPLTLNMVINGNNVGSLTPPMSPNNCNWQTYSSSVWNSGTSTSVTICIQNATNTASLLAIDNLNFSPVLTCTYTDEITINMVNTITPTFAQVGPYCSGATIPALPTTSQNGITGTWSPVINNTATTTYTFTPTAGQCATTATMTITITPNVTPTFAQVGPYCSGVTIPPLATTSQNGITGTWSPAINNTSTTIYTFTPTAGQCATTATMTITITPNVTPTFAQVGPYCSGATIPALPTTSQNGITGTWSPVINNTATTTYTFTPTPGQCATTATMTITIAPNVTPTFSQVGPYCSGVTIPALPTTSQNGINGTWSPAINNTATTTYTFTPTAGQCATTATLTITITPNVTPTFAQVVSYCSGSTIPALPTTSQNGINGTWSPAINNTATTTYTFTPTAGQCATTATLTITITTNPTPTFTQVGPYCSGVTIPALPTTSQNGINGTWSPAINNTATTTYTFTPMAGQCALTTTMTITVISTQVQITCPPNSTVTCDINNLPPYNSLASFVAAGGSATSIGGTLVSNSFALVSQTISGTCPQIVTRTYTVQDDCGNSATCTQTITVNDQIAPTGNAPANVTVTCSTLIPPVNVNSLTNVADNCSVPVVTHLSDVSNNQTCPEIITRTYRITDACGNFTDVVQTITVNDNVPPTGNIANVTVTCSTLIPPVNVNAVTNVADNCSVPVVTHIGDVSNNQICLEIISRTYRITDACGNTTDVVQTITVNDNIPPTGTAPANVTISCASQIPPVNINLVTNVSDNCSVPVVTHLSDVSNNQTCPQIVARTYRITDACGNFTDVVQNIIIQDLIAPTGTAPASIGVICSTLIPAPNINLVTNVSDNCSIPVVTHLSDVSNNQTCPEIVTRTYRITDACGNFTDVFQSITVNDQIAPTGNAPANAVVSCSTLIPPVNVNTVTNVADNCSVPIVTHLSDVSNNQTCPQIITRTYRITDACGNFTDVVQTITVNDNVPPTGNIANVTVTCSTLIPPVNVNAVTNVADNCSVPVVTHIGDVSNNQTCSQIVTRTYRITDACGNITDVVQTITVNDNVPPTGTAPANVNVPCLASVPSPNVNAVTNVSDNCSVPVVAFVGDVSDGNICNQQTITRTYSITDFCGNQTLVTQTIVIDAVTPNATLVASNPTTCQGTDGSILITGLLPNQSLSITMNAVSNNYVANALGQVLLSGLSQGSFSGFVITPINCSACQQIINQNIVLSDPPNPEVDAGGDITICEGEYITLTALNFNNANISWSNGVQDGQTFSPPVGTYTYTVTAEIFNCFASDQVTVLVNPNPVVDAGSMQGICNGNTVVLTATGAVSYVWNNGVQNGVPFQQNSPTVVYSVVGTAANGCTDEAHVLVNILTNPTPSFTVSQSTSCVLPVEVQFIQTTPQFTGSCVWSFGDGQTSDLVDSSFNVYTTEGCFDVTLSVVYGNGCHNSFTISDAICIWQTPIAAFVVNPTSPSVGNTTSFINQSQNATSYFWNLGLGNYTQEHVNYTYGSSGVYDVVLVAVNNIGCADTAKASIVITNPLNLYVPNTFTPDGDAYNNTFQPVLQEGFDPYNYELLIFNRWGEVLFESKNAAVGWDGTYGGKLCPEGTYIWQIRVKNGSGIFEMHRGHVTLSK